jgi:hypothetical protein
MMKLAFPTLAEIAVTKFEESTKTISLSVISQRMGAIRDDEGALEIVWVFPDDSTLHVRGRGRAHDYWTDLP